MSLVNACKCGDEDLVKQLIEFGADVNECKWYPITYNPNLRYEDYPPLYYACENRHENIVKYLI